MQFMRNIHRRITDSPDELQIQKMIRGIYLKRVADTENNSENLPREVTGIEIMWKVPQSNCRYRNNSENLDFCISEILFLQSENTIGQNSYIISSETILDAKNTSIPND